MLKKLPDCNRCFFYSHDPQIVCAVHPAGPVSSSCMDFRVDLESRDGREANRQGHRFTDLLGLLEDETTPEPDGEQWEPEGAWYIESELVIERLRYNGEEITQPRQRWTTEQQLELLDWQKMFTGRCLQCGSAIERDSSVRVHWDCPL